MRQALLFNFYKQRNQSRALWKTDGTLGMISGEFHEGTLDKAVDGRWGKNGIRGCDASGLVGTAGGFTATPRLEVLPEPQIERAGWRGCQSGAKMAGCGQPKAPREHQNEVSGLSFLHPSEAVHWLNPAGSPGAGKPLMPSCGQPPRASSRWRRMENGAEGANNHHKSQSTVLRARAPLQGPSRATSTVLQEDCCPRTAFLEQKQRSQSSSPCEY